MSAAMTDARLVEIEHASIAGDYLNDAEIDELTREVRRLHRDVNTLAAALAGSTTPPDDETIVRHIGNGGAWAVSGRLSGVLVSGTDKALEAAAQHRESIGSEFPIVWRWLAIKAGGGVETIP